MHSKRSYDRGFVRVSHPTYLEKYAVHDCLVQESSAVGDYDNACETPGSSFLWIGDYHHLNREEVAELIARMQHWLDTGRLKVDGEEE